jgi:hypothetical protein
MGVSGGSYIAASRALVAHSLPVGAEHAYAPGTPEEQYLRGSHHMTASPAMVLVGVLSFVRSALITYAVWLAPLYVAAHAWGWFLHQQGVLVQRGPPAGMIASVTAWTWWLVPAVAFCIMILLFVVWRPRPMPGGGAQYARAASVGGAALIAAGLAVTMLAVPLAVSWLYHSGATFSGIVHFFSPGKGLSLLAQVLQALKTVAALAAVLAAVARAALASFTRSSRQITHDTGPGQGVSRRQRAGGLLLPWLGTALVVLAGATAALLWTGQAAAAGFTRGQLALVLTALAVVLFARQAADINRLSAQDFYRRRLAAAFAVTRQAAAASDPAERARLFADADQAQLSSLSTSGTAVPGLVICATANASAMGGLPIVFDPEHVTLPGTKRNFTARTSDYEALVGGRWFTLFDVATISGVMVSPLMGAMTRQAYRILRTMTNVRPGVWLPHPRVVANARAYLNRPRKDRDPDSWWTWRPALLLLWYLLPHWVVPSDDRMREKRRDREARLWAHVLNIRRSGERSGGALGRMQGALLYRTMQPTLGMLWAEAAGHSSYRDIWTCVTDGSHYDGLGLVEALRRGADHIVVLDASDAYPSAWATLARAVNRARTEIAAEITIDPTPMVGSEDSDLEEADRLRAGTLARPWVRGTFCGVGGQGEILVCRLGSWPGAPWDVRSYAAGHPEFPWEPAAVQEYDNAEFEAYRRLGAATVDEALAVPAARRSRRT